MALTAKTIKPEPIAWGATPRFREKVLRRFWARVNRGAESDCWEWTGSRFRRGYGQFSIGYKNRPAHRVVMEIEHGAVPDGLSVLHRCDNPPCVNPAHLFFGTGAENMADRDAKGRQARQKGEAHGLSKLTEPQVAEIRALAFRGAETQRAIAQRFGIHQCHVSDIKRGKRWAHLAA